MLSRDPALALKRLVLPVSYWRSAEFSYVFQHLDAPTGSRVLDLGSPKDLALFLAHRRSYQVVATDILDKEVKVANRLARAQGISGPGAGRVVAEVQDGRRLPYRDSSFDGVYSVSVLEHIPDHGDSAALAELIRVVRPGGVVVVTVPFDREYRETFVERSVYERERSGAERVFYERHYDREALETRLLKVAAAKVESCEVWGEKGLRAEAMLAGIGRLRIAASPLEPLLAALFLHNSDKVPTIRPMAAFVTLRK
jgi:SAM-dependent methyltransferase